VPSSYSESTIPDLFDKVKHSVVNVSPSPGSENLSLSGSGFVYDKQGHILTNNHVTGAASSVLVTFIDGNQYDSSSMSVSEDSRLRQSIRNIAIEESRFLQETGTAEMELEIEKKVLHLSSKFKRNSIEETGIKPSLTDEEIREYLEQVMNEIKPKE
jgi:hypothetical protein